MTRDISPAAVGPHLLTCVRQACFKTTSRLIFQLTSIDIFDVDVVCVHCLAFYVFLYPQTVEKQLL